MGTEVRAIRMFPVLTWVQRLIGTKQPSIDMGTEAVEYHATQY